MVSTGLPEEKLQRERELAAERARWEYYKPLIIMGLCGILGVLAALVTGGWDQLLYGLIAWCVLAVGMFVFYFISCVTWSGADAPLLMCSVRCMAIAAVTSLAIAFNPFTSAPRGSVLFLAIMIATGMLLYAYLFDMDRQDAVIFSVATIGTPLVLLYGLSTFAIF